MHPVRAILCLLLLAGCAAPAPRQASDIPNSDLLALDNAREPLFLPPPDLAVPDGDLERKAAEAAASLERLLASGALDRVPATSDQQPALSEVPEPPPTPQELVGPLPEPAEPIASDPEPPQTFDPLLEMAQRMARLLREPADGKPRIPDAIALGPIEALEPGVLFDLESPTNHLGVRLTSEDRAALIQARNNILDNPGLANAALVQALSRLAPPSTLKIARAALCSRVAGFGHFDAFPTTSFISGRPIRAIVYVEIDGFTARPAREGDPVQANLSLAEQVSVDLAQSLTLYQDPSGLLSWHRPARPVIETSRNKRRDFYIIHQIELPATLSIGRYNLKVLVKDRTTGAEAEAIIPIQIVADRSAVK